MQSATLKNISAYIKGYDSRLETKKKVVYYTFQFTADNTTWEVEKRFSELSNIHN